MNPIGVVPVLVHDGNIVVEFERDLHITRRSIPGSAAHAKKRGGARCHDALVQTARRYPTHACATVGFAISFGRQLKRQAGARERQRSLIEKGH